jgi:hypothetical protein
MIILLPGFGQREGGLMGCAASRSSRVARVALVSLVAISSQPSALCSSLLPPHSSQPPSSSRLTPHASFLTPYFSRLTSPVPSLLTPYTSRFTPLASRLSHLRRGDLPQSISQGNSLILEPVQKHMIGNCQALLSIGLSIKRVPCSNLFE